MRDTMRTGFATVDDAATSIQQYTSNRTVCPEPASGGLLTPDPSPTHPHHCLVRESSAHATSSLCARTCGKGRTAASTGTGTLPSLAAYVQNRGPWPSH